MDKQIELSPHILKVLTGFIEFANNPTQTSAVFDIADGLRHNTELYKQFTDHAHSQDSVSQIIHERYFPSAIDLDSLLSYPSDSLGFCYAKSMHGLKPDFYRVLDIEDDYSYIAMRATQTHDIWHIVTGFDNDLVGEAGLQAFVLAQIRSPLAIALLGAFMVFVLKSSSSLSPLMGAIQRGWQMGEMASPFLAQKWEEHWDKPLSEWRADLKIDSFFT